MSCRSIDLVSIEMEALRLVDGWPAERVAVGVRLPRQAMFGVHGSTDEFRWASVTKLGRPRSPAWSPRRRASLDLDEPAGPPGSTVRHLLAHASGLPFEAGSPIAKPGERRIYSDARLRGARGARSRRGRRCRSRTYLRAAVLEPLGLERALRRQARLGALGHARRSARVRARAARADARLGGDVRRGDGRRSSRARRRAARASAARAERLGPRVRAARREVAALDGHAQLAAHVRPLRRQRHVPLGRPGGRHRARAA